MLTEDSALTRLGMPEVAASDPHGDLVATEHERLRWQEEIDRSNTAKDRNKNGQYATPPALAEAITRAVAPYVSAHESVTVLEPSCGTGSFFSALRRDERLGDRIERASGIEIDSTFARAAHELWHVAGLNVVNADFLSWVERAPERFSLILSNPPYVRHQHLGAERKSDLRRQVQQTVDIDTSGMSGLYVYFILAAHGAMEPGAVAAWLIPANFLDANYGASLRDYLTKKVTLKRIHRFDRNDPQFTDALVTSALVVLTNDLPDPLASVEFTGHGSLDDPQDRRLVRTKELVQNGKWSRLFDKRRPVDRSPSVPLGDLFTVTRGVATGANNYFISSPESAMERGISGDVLKPLLPVTRKLATDHVRGDERGWPILENLQVVIDTDLATEEIEHRYPGLFAYLMSAGPEIHKRYLVRKRNPWYSQERRDPPMFFCTYMGRSVLGSRPFRFIRNDSTAIATNSYLLMYPTASLQSAIDKGTVSVEDLHAALQRISTEDMHAESRSYGGGLSKFEPGDLRRLRVRGVDF